MEIHNQHRAILLAVLFEGQAWDQHFTLSLKVILHPISERINLLFKFADDANLIVPETTYISAYSEILNLKSWAFENAMEINWDKTKELICRKPNLSHSLLPDLICSIEQVLESRLLEYYFWKI